MHALIAQWRKEAESARSNARVFILNAIEDESYEWRAMGRAQTYTECAAVLEAALAAATLEECCCEIDRHDFNCPIHNDSGPSRRGPNGDE